MHTKKFSIRVEKLAVQCSKTRSAGLLRFVLRTHLTRILRAHACTHTNIHKIVQRDNIVMTQTQAQTETRLYTKAACKDFNDVSTTNKPLRTPCSGNM
jgi:hypothetical protein